MGFRGWKNLLGAEPTVFPSNGKAGTAAERIFPILEHPNARSSDSWQKP
jgi:hypothetical protein